MSKHIDGIVTECDVCQSLRPANPAAVTSPSPPATFPMEALGTDILNCGGKDWLVVVDRYSGFPLVRQLHSMASAAVIRRLDAIFWEFGLPNRVRSDGGPARNSVNSYLPWTSRTRSPPPTTPPATASRRQE